MRLLPPPLAEFGSIEKTAISVLAVAGGFLIGYLATGVLAHVVNKFTLRKQSPGRLVRFLKMAGGTAAAIAIYLMLSGEGGFGFGGKGGGNSQSKNEGKSDAATNPNKDTPDKSKTTDVKQKTKDEEVRGTPLSVYILGVDASNGRFFRFEDEAQPLTDEEIIQRIEQLEKAGKLKNKQVRLKAGADNMSVPQYAKIYSKLRADFEPRGFEIIPLKSEMR
jgi:hypothetical protein